ncbi:heat-shock protein Hsp20 [Streptococcus iniae]|uniref:Heat-shock protein Hsp20 n=1 Tax=Streptococcus iniae TaxID=1346 RepID=A0A3L8GGT1_STRIN|nr:hypothetical protein K710_1735 [Streptococcus iniae SF1]AYB01532.1 heat-shock protein Hsp20 [Streptococcus iniae]EKB51932.1 small heat shock protein ibp [Streptococcus iniae 9117]AYB03395.1 heat-shock protein Hsp20 [Streptococcus iniae]RLU27997.1 heat-shock protein Hsp20 [Streptococcus iniae]
MFLLFFEKTIDFSLKTFYNRVVLEFRFFEKELPNDIWKGDYSFSFQREIF